MEVTTSRELANFMLWIARKYKFVPEDSGSFLETYRRYPKFFSKVLESDEMIRFIVQRKDAIWLLNHVFSD